MRNSLVNSTAALTRIAGVQHKLCVQSQNGDQALWTITAGPRVVQFEQGEFGIAVEFNGVRTEYSLDSIMPRAWMAWLSWLADAPKAVA